MSIALTGTQCTTRLEKNARLAANAAAFRSASVSGGALCAMRDSEGDKLTKYDALKLMTSFRLKFGESDHIEAARVLDLQAQLQQLGAMDCQKCGGSGVCDECDAECGECDGEGNLDGSSADYLEEKLTEALARADGASPIFHGVDRKQMVLQVDV